MIRNVIRKTLRGPRFRPPPRAVKPLWGVGLGLLVLLGPVSSLEATHPGSRNPFLLPEEVYFIGQEPVSEKVSLTLQAVVTGGQRKVATINNRNLVRGDRIEGQRVVRILEDRVILEKGGRQIVLVLQQPSAPARIRRER